MNAPLLPGFDLAPQAAPVPAAFATPRAVSPVKPLAQPAPGRLEMSPAYFRARQFLASLSPRERAAVASPSTLSHDALGPPCRHFRR